jgi:catechol O-methyltransferase
MSKTRSITLPKTFGGFDGRELECLRHIQMSTPRNDPHAIIQGIDQFAYQQKWLMNVGDVKGKILDESLRKCQPKLVLEVGTYIGYSSLRMIQQIPKDAKIITIEASDKIAPLARDMIEHAGMTSRIQVVNGFLQDFDFKTMKYLQERIPRGSIDFVFLDHFKEAYLPDLLLLLESGLLHPGTVVFADNVEFPGAPAYKKFMEEQEGKTFQTKEYKTLLEYQSQVSDLVLESTYLGGMPGLVSSPL